MQQRIAPWESLVFAAAGAAGAVLVARGVTAAYPRLRPAKRTSTREALSSGRGMQVREAMTIARPAGELYARWRRLETLPDYLRHVTSVRELDATRSRWTVRGPGGKPVSWDAELVNDDGTTIAWQSIPGSEVVTAGSVRFTPVARGTELVVNLRYDPPGGHLGALLATLFGKRPSAQIREDLRAFKRIVEAGEIPTSRTQPSGRRTALFRAVEAWQ